MNLLRGNKMSATTFVEENNGTTVSQEIYTLFEGNAENEFAVQWQTNPSLWQTSNVQLTEITQDFFGNIEVRTNDTEQTSYEDIPSSTKELSFYNTLQQKVFYKLRFPPHWAAEGVHAPNVTAKTNGFKICWELYKKYDLHPDRILSTKEEGVYIVYECTDSRGSRSLIIEAYNDGEIGLVVCDNQTKKVIYNEDIINMNFEDAVKKFTQSIC